MTQTWEVSIPQGTNARIPQAREIEPGADMSHLIASLLRSGEAVLIIRTDQTPEAKREKWEADFYDIDKAGRRRRRYKKTQLEKEWEEVAKTIKQERKEASSQAKRQRSKSLNDSDATAECGTCGFRWYSKAAEYGLVHECGKGLIHAATQEG